MSVRAHQYERYPLALRSLLIQMALCWCPGLDPLEACVIVVGACKMTKERMG